LPFDFVKEEGRTFSGIVYPTSESPTEILKSRIQSVLEAEDYYQVDWWENEEYYIQMLVEKIDLKTLFKDICGKYGIPIATSKGWGSITQRAEIGRRFKEAEARGNKCILLYFGDHDPDGIRISDFLKDNLNELKNGIDGYDPKNLIVERVGLNKDFIDKHNLTWIDNLKTGNGGDLGSPKHKDHNKPYVKDYIKKYGKRKCEANALVTIPDIAKKLVEDVIVGYLGDIETRIIRKRHEVNNKFEGLRKKVGLDTNLKDVLEELEKK